MIFDDEWFQCWPAVWLNNMPMRNYINTLPWTWPPVLRKPSWRKTRNDSLAEAQKPLEARVKQFLAHLFERNSAARCCGDMQRRENMVGISWPKVTWSNKSMEMAEIGHWIYSVKSQAFWITEGGASWRRKQTSWISCRRCTCDILWVIHGNRFQEPEGFTKDAHIYHATPSLESGWGSQDWLRVPKMFLSAWGMWKPVRTYSLLLKDYGMQKVGFAFMHCNQQIR